MIPIPFTRMAVSLSGGGYRATTFHLGALSLLDAIELEAGNSLILEEERRAKGGTVLENVRIISTISGGTLTGIMYALKLAQGGHFKDCYYKLHDLLTEDQLVEHALAKLNNPRSWSNQYKNRNLINAFAEVYNEHFYDGATFGDLYRDRHSHLQEVIFGASEFTAGLQYRFQRSSTGYFGANDLYIPKTVSERIRLADSAASSSCFPGGFEPMTMPNDFSNGPETRVEEWWIKKKINFAREAATAVKSAQQPLADMARAAEQDPLAVEGIRAPLAAFVAGTFAARRAEELAEQAALEALEATDKAEQAVERASRAAKKAEQEMVDPDTRTKLVAAAQKAKKKAVEEEQAAALKRQAAEQAQTAAQTAHDDLIGLAERAKEIKREKPALAAILLVGLRAQAEVERAMAAVEEAAQHAEVAVMKADAAAQSAAEKAERDRLLAKEKLDVASRAVDRAAALGGAETLAVKAEKSSAKAQNAAILAAEAHADRALITVEKVVEATIATREAIHGIAAQAARDEMLQKAIQLATNAAEQAAYAERTALAADAAAQAVHQEEQKTTSAASQAEEASAKVATHCTTKGYAAEYVDANTYKGKGNYKSKLPLVKHKDTSKVAAPIIDTDVTSSATQMAVKSAQEVARATQNTLTQLKAAATALANNDSSFSQAMALAGKAASEATAAAAAAEQKSTLARNDKAFHPTTAIMDGGILDNQGIRGVVMAEKRYSKGGKKDPYIGTYIISDVSGESMSPYTVPAFQHSTLGDLFTLKRINAGAFILFLGIIGLLLFVKTSTLGVVLASIFLTILALWLVLFLAIRSVFRARVSETFAGDDLPEIMRDLKVLVNTPVYVVLHLVKFRASSALKMITDIFLRRIRQLQLHDLYKSWNWNYRLVSNNIYTLKGAAKLTAELKKVVEAANHMPTTLWFSQKEKDQGALNDLIACGQLTLCKNLIGYIKDLQKENSSKRERVWDNIPEHHAAIQAIQTTLEAYWEKFRVNPYWLIEQLEEQREAHQAQQKEEEQLLEWV